MMKFWKFTLMPRILVDLALSMVVLHLYVKEKFTLTLDTGFDSFLLILFLTIVSMVLVYPAASRRLCLLILVPCGAAFGVSFYISKRMGGDKSSLLYLIAEGLFILMVAGFLSLLNAKSAAKRPVGGPSVPVSEETDGAAEKEPEVGIPVRDR